jgi:hypothetical protein
MLDEVQDVVMMTADTSMDDMGMLSSQKDKM